MVIPSLEPSERLFDVLAGLRQQGFTNIIVVNDGSPVTSDPLFIRARDEFGCTVLRHSHNKGKGRALKTAFEHCAGNPTITSVITVDSDGQHLPSDATKVAVQVLDNEALGRPAAVFGSRDFSSTEIPFKSRYGNRITTKVVKTLFGQTINDTQTGLRGFPRDLALRTAGVPGEGFEYEMNVLMWLLGEGVPIDQVRIETVYHDAENSQSHFRPFRDSARIYSAILGQLATFSGASIASTLADLGVYVLMVDGVFNKTPGATEIMASAAVARLISMNLNFVLNRRLVFKASNSARVAMTRYYGLAAGILVASATGTAVMSRLLEGHHVFAKILVDTILFLASYLVQKRWVFRVDPA